MGEPNHYIYNTPVGKITLESDGEAITHLVFGEAALAGKRAPNAVTNLAANQLQEYLAGRRRYFDVPVHLAGTDFQKRVWAEISDIPYGSTRTYAQIAQAIGSPGAYRAVGRAANANPVPLIVPCHRVVGSRGNLVGYAFGVDAKKFLLDLESRVSQQAE